MAGKPGWRKGVDAVEGVLTPAAGNVVRNDTFALSLAVVARARRGVVGRAERLSRQALHLLNLPAGSDINRLLRSIASVEREVRELAKQVEKIDSALPARDQPREGTSMPSISLTEALGRISRDVDRIKVRAHNGLRHLSGLPMGPIGATPRHAVWTRDNVTLYRYSGGGARGPLLLVHSLVTQPYVFDLRPGSSLVEDLTASGHEVFLLDWGIPGPVEAANTLETYTLEYIPLAVEAVAKSTGKPRVDILGYCLGAVLSLLAVAARPDLPVRRLVALATPIDFGELGPLSKLLQQHQLEPADMFDETGNVPASLILSGFRMSQPTGDIATYANLWQSLANDEHAAAHQAFVGWSSAHIPFPGRAFEQMVDLMVRGDLLRTGWFPLGGRQVELSSITCPVLSVTGDRDNLVPPAATAPLAAALGGQLETLTLPAGHAGLFVGRQAKKNGIPAILAWLGAPDRARSE